MCVYYKPAFLVCSALRYVPYNCYQESKKKKIKLDLNFFSSFPEDVL